MAALDSNISGKNQKMNTLNEPVYQCHININHKSQYFNHYFYSNANKGKKIADFLKVRSPYQGQYRLSLVMQQCQ